MSSALIEKLTDKEREALRLVNRHLTSKEIGRKLGISVPAVDARLKGATRKLGVEDRRKAAVLLADHEAQPHYQETIYGSSEVAPEAASGSLGLPARSALHEVQQPFRWDSPRLTAEADAAAPLGEKERNTLGSWQRLGVIALIGAGTIFCMALLISALNGLVQLATVRGQLF